LRFETVKELARSLALDLPATSQLRRMVQVLGEEPLTYQNFLSKFAPLRPIYRSQEIIQRITMEAIADAAADNVRYLELRFTPVALSRNQGFPLGRVMDWVIEGAQKAEKDFGITTRLIASFNRHESVALAAQVAVLAGERMTDGIVGLDLAGNEVDFPAEPFIEIMRFARQKGLHITVHAGEWSDGDGILTAIHQLGAERIGHGIRVLESPGALRAAHASQIPFEVCITSNFQSGAITDLSAHPLSRMLGHGLNVTINTDDPGISAITLSDEYCLACEFLGLPLPSLGERTLAAAQAAFLPEHEKQALIIRLKKEQALYFS